MARSIRARVVLSGALFALASCFVAGCGGKVYHVSGKVTYKGQPVPAGRIYFNPDGSKGNKEGGSGFADIKDGAYDTSASGGRGLEGPGAVWVLIEGWDPNAPTTKNEKSGDEVRKPLFPRYETSTEVTDPKTTKDFDVQEAAKTGTPGKGPAGHKGSPLPKVGPGSGGP